MIQLDRPDFQEVERALEEIAATSADYHVADSPERLVDLSRMTAGFMKVAIESKMVTAEEMHIVIGLFNMAADKWLRQNEGR